MTVSKEISCVEGERHVTQVEYVIRGSAYSIHKLLNDAMKYCCMFDADEENRKLSFDYHVNIEQIKSLSNWEVK